MAAKRVPVVCHGHSRPIVEVNFSTITPDGYFLASASKDCQPMLRHGETGDWYGTFQGHKGAVWACELNEPALLAATGSADFSARIWDACSGNQLHEFHHKHIVRTVSWNKSNKLATGGKESMIRIYDAQQPDSEPITFPQADAKNGIRCLQWLQEDHLLLATLSDTPGISVYDVRSLKQVQHIETAAPVLSLEVSYDQKHITTAEGKCVRVFDAASLTQRKEFQLKHSAESASYCASKRKLVAGGEDMWVRLYDYDTGQEVECNKGHHGPVHTIRFAPTYESYASGSEDGTIRIWFLDADGVTTKSEAENDARRADQ